MRALLLLAIALLSACATKYDRLRSYAGADYGTVVVSLGQTRENKMNFSSLWFRLKGTEVLGDFQYNSKYILQPSPIDFSTNRGEGTLIAKKLPPSDYEITDYSSGSDYGTSVVTYRNRTPMVIPFSVKTGEVSYIGQYLVGLEFVAARAIAAELEISNEELRDLKGSKAVPPFSMGARSFVPIETSNLPAHVRVVR